MFRKLATILAAAMLTLSASSAFASFADMELIRVYYERTTGTAEIATDLGSISSILAAPTTTVAGSFGTVTNYNNLYAVYFAIDRTNNHMWVSNSTTVTPAGLGGAGWTGTKNGSTPMYTYYNSLGAGPTVTGLQSNL